jgi:hypothetical protein
MRKRDARLEALALTHSIIESQLGQGVTYDLWSEDGEAKAVAEELVNIQESLRKNIGRFK